MICRLIDPGDCSEGGPEGIGVRSQGRAGLAYYCIVQDDSALGCSSVHLLDHRIAARASNLARIDEA